MGDWKVDQRCEIELQSRGNGGDVKDLVWQFTVGELSYDNKC